MRPLQRKALRTRSRRKTSAIPGLRAFSLLPVLTLLRRVYQAPHSIRRVVVAVMANMGGIVARVLKRLPHPNMLPAIPL